MPIYHEYTHGDRFAPKRWAHRKRFVDTIDALQLRPRDRVLDFGCGDGFFLEQCLSMMPPAQLVGYDPMPTMATQARDRLSPKNIQVFDRLEQLTGQTFSRVVCLETCEHLVPPEREKVLASIHRILPEDGRALFTVPVEIGPVSLIKNLYRKLRRKQYENLSWLNVLSAAIGIAPKQRISLSLGAPYIFSHVGFDYRKFERELHQDYTIERRFATPFNRLPAWMNVTVGYVCRPRIRV